MVKSSPKAPAAPDPVTTSAAQTQSNKDTALFNFGLNNPTYNTPLGSVNYNVDTSDPNQPRSTANVTLSPEQQQLLNEQNQQSLGLSRLADQLQGRVGDSLSQPLPNYGDIQGLAKNAQDAYYANQTQYLDPQFANQKSQMDASLANQGITQGSEAYNNAQNQYGLQKQQAYSNAQNNAIQYGPQNAQQLFALNSEQRSQPLNEFNALRTGSQVSMPQLPGTAQSQAQPTNVMGAYNTAYQGAQNQYNQQMASNNALTSGLFSLGGSLGAAAIMSDRRLKTNIERIGQTDSGIPVYRYKYRGADNIHIGVMADEVKAIIPAAVIRMASGFDAVDYARVK